MTRIMHVACHLTNIGDGALIAGLQTSLRRTRNDLHFTNIDLMRSANWWGEQRFDERFFRQADGHDLLLVGGGGLINAGTRDVRSGFTFDADPTALRASRVPTVFYAIGVNLFGGEKLAHPNALSIFLDTVRDAPDRFLFTLREDGSLERLQQLLNRELDFISEVPDPAHYLPMPAPTQRAGRRKKVIVQLAGDREDLRFGANRTAILQRLARVLDRLEREADADFVLAPHLIWDTTPMADMLRLAHPRISRFHCDSLPVMRGSRAARRFFRAYGDADLVLAMRGHSVICSVGAGVPFIALTSHPKVGGYLKVNRMSDYSISLQDADLEDRLVHLAQALLQDPSDFRRLRDAAMARANSRASTLHEKMLGWCRTQVSPR